MAVVRGAPSARQVLGQAIRRFRERERLTLEQLGDRSGISYQYLCDVESGRQNFSIGVLEKVAQGLGLSVITLVTAAYGQSLTIGFATRLGGATPVLATAHEAD